jgi:hypothetical protein
MANHAIRLEGNLAALYPDGDSSIVCFRQFCMVLKV